ncbi:MAG: hypothetical protein Q8L86_20255 [Vicinamibacterales bacterium]|nr:hypothetical protein [Vicinamibacterales bacterium]
MTHLRPDELVDLLDGALAPGRAAHLETCDLCREEAARLAMPLDAARGAGVPEPSEGEWARFSTRLSSAIEAEPSPGWGWLSWLAPPVLVPIAGLAVLVFALAVSVDRVAERGGWGAPVAVVTDAAVDDESDAWPALVEVLAALDLSEVDAFAGTGIDVRPGVSERLVAGLSREEFATLQRLIEDEAGVAHP